MTLSLSQCFETSQVLTLPNIMDRSSLDRVHKKHFGNKNRCCLRHSVRRVVYPSYM